MGGVLAAIRTTIANLTKTTVNLAIFELSFVVLTDLQVLR
eukprot:COSAG02_NODE_4095_length_5788_cov_3.722271_8_plen_40_part_00